MEVCPQTYMKNPSEDKIMIHNKTLIHKIYKDIIIHAFIQLQFQLYIKTEQNTKLHAQNYIASIKSMFLIGSATYAEQILVD